MAIKYTYKEYKNFPEASEISESRARGSACLSVIHPLTLLTSIIFLIVDFLESWPIIFFIPIPIISLIYLVHYYPLVTEKKINKAIEKRLHMLDEIKDSKFACKHIEILEEYKKGTCQKCFSKDKDLTLCKIKNDIGEREIFICSNCMYEFNKNSLNKQ